MAPYASGFSSSLTADLGWKPDLSLIFNKVNTTSTIRIDEKDSLHLRWRLGSKGTPDSVIVFQDGRVLVGSRSKFDPASKNRLDGELTAAIEIINGTNKLPDAVRLKALSHIQYYSQDSPVDAESWRLCGDQLYKANSDACFNNAVLLGYNGSGEYQWAVMTGPQIMGGTGKSMSLAGGELAAMGLLLAWMLRSGKGLSL